MWLIVEIFVRRLLLCTKGESGTVWKCVIFNCHRCIGSLIFIMWLQFINMHANTSKRKAFSHLHQHVKKNKLYLILTPFFHKQCQHHKITYYGNVYYMLNVFEFNGDCLQSSPFIYFIFSAFFVFLFHAINLTFYSFFWYIFK